MHTKKNLKFGMLLEVLFTNKSSMHSDKNLQFIKSKILDTEVAIFHCLTNSILRIPNAVIRTLKADNDGNIYFFVARPPQLVSQFDQAFPVSLKYFKKGKTYTVRVFGTANMITNATEINEDLKLSSEEISNALCTQLLLKVKISKVEFYDLAAHRKNILQQLKTFIYSLVNYTEPQGVEYDFSPRTPIRYGF